MRPPSPERLSSVVPSASSVAPSVVAPCVVADWTALDSNPNPSPNSNPNRRACRPHSGVCVLAQGETLMFHRDSAMDSTCKVNVSSLVTKCSHLFLLKLKRKEARDGSFGLFPPRAGNSLSAKSLLVATRAKRRARGAIGTESQARELVNVSPSPAPLPSLASPSSGSERR